LFKITNKLELHKLPTPKDKNNVTDLPKSSIIKKLSNIAPTNKPQTKDNITKNSLGNKVLHDNLHNNIPNGNPKKDAIIKKTVNIIGIIFTTPIIFSDNGIPPISVKNRIKQINISDAKDAPKIIGKYIFLKDFFIIYLKVIILNNKNEFKSN